MCQTARSASAPGLLKNQQSAAGRHHRIDRETNGLVRNPKQQFAEEPPTLDTQPVLTHCSELALHLSRAGHTARRRTCPAGNVAIFQAPDVLPGADQLLQHARVLERLAEERHHLVLPRLRHLHPLLRAHQTCN